MWQLIHTLYENDDKDGRDVVSAWWNLFGIQVRFAVLFFFLLLILSQHLIVTRRPGERCHGAARHISLLAARCMDQNGTLLQGQKQRSVLFFGSSCFFSFNLF